MKGSCPYYHYFFNRNFCNTFIVDDTYYSNYLFDPFEYNLFLKMHFNNFDVLNLKILFIYIFF